MESKLRVFLSADLVGSTKLKNRLNHKELLEKYRARCHVIDRLRKQTNRLMISEEDERAAVLESLAVSTDDFDWSSVVFAFYDGLHAAFLSSLQRRSTEISFSLDNTFAPWKAVGDELIYSIPVNGRKELHYVTIAFLIALRELDAKIANRPGNAAAGLRIKGAAWVAGFPVRNREIKLPPDDRLDFLGPDMDTGFRIGKCTKSGMLVSSIELAELLGECQAEFAPMLGKVVGWEELKGVWNDQRYPIIWIDFPDSHPDATLRAAKEFNLWEQEESTWCKVWSDSSKTKEQLSALAVTIRELRTALPPSLGLVDPYISGDALETSTIPQDHTEILNLLKMIECHRAAVSSQDADVDSPVASDSIESDIATLRELVE